MNVISSNYEILTPISEGGIDELKHIERIGRVCYKSEGNITEDSSDKDKLEIYLEIENVIIVYDDVYSNLSLSENEDYQS